MTGVGYTLIAVLILLAAITFFVAAEFALVRVRGFQLNQTLAEGQRAAKASIRAAFGGFSNVVRMTMFMLMLVMPNFAAATTDRQIVFVQGNIEFILLHELAHVVIVISIFQLSARKKVRPTTLPHSP